jgi:putative NIF3 family GTP cyclohydrolase 1 type 2
LASVSLRNLAKDVEKRLNLKAMRVIGDPNMRVRRASLLYGTPPFHASASLQKVDVAIAGEQREWEGVEYTADAMTAGESKGMILIGHWISEDQGMRTCAQWLKKFVSEVPIEWIPAGDPFWRP